MQFTQRSRRGSTTAQSTCVTVRSRLKASRRRARAHSCSLRSSIGPTVTAQRGGGRPGLYRRLDMNATPLAAGGPHRRKCDAQRAHESSLRWRCRRQAHSGTMHVWEGEARGEEAHRTANSRAWTLLPRRHAMGCGGSCNLRARRAITLVAARGGRTLQRRRSTSWQYQMKPPKFFFSIT